MKYFFCKNLELALRISFQSGRVWFKEDQDSMFMSRKKLG